VPSICLSLSLSLSPAPFFAVFAPRSLVSTVSSLLPLAYLSFCSFIYLLPPLILFPHFSPCRQLYNEPRQRVGYESVADSDDTRIVLVSKFDITCSGLLFITAHLVRAQCLPVNFTANIHRPHVIGRNRRANARFSPASVRIFAYRAEFSDQESDENRTGM